MNNLPIELMVKILKNLKQVDLDNAVEVCDDWKDMIYDTIGVQRSIGKTDGVYVGFDVLPKLMEIKEIGVTGMNYCVIGDISDEEELPNYRSAYLMKKMSFVGLIGEDTFKKLVDPLTNLTRLSFELTTLNNFKFSSGLQLPKLKHVKLVGVNMRAKNELKDDNLWTNFLKIYLDSYFPQLQVVYFMEIPLLSPNDGKILLDALIAFLDKHKKTLQKFCLFVPRNTIEVGNTIPIIPQVQMTDELKLTHVQFVGFKTSQVCHELNGILKTQTNIKSYVNELLSFDPNIILQNSITLVNVELIFNHTDVDLNGNPLNIDFNVFKSCMALKYLALSGTGRVTNTANLPTSMESIRIVRFHMDSKDASDLITMKWTNSLKSLELRRIGDHENYGVPFDAICTLMKEKTIARVLIFDGFNKQSVDVASKSTLQEKLQLPGLGLNILERCRCRKDIQFGLDIEQNYVFMEWAELPKKLYLSEEPNPLFINGLFSNTLF